MHIGLVETASNVQCVLITVTCIAYQMVLGDLYALGGDVNFPKRLRLLMRNKNENGVREKASLRSG